MTGAWGRDDRHPWKGRLDILAVPEILSEARTTRLTLLSTVCGAHSWDRSPASPGGLRYGDHPVSA
ncbi:hypothetical protein ACFOWE_32035 [Planomonospora corallina]|uniref:Uncharacterized protein n=1 Tax=Planomonospora corallina TaxID=1806052 RepID=A0ABV8IIK5_9ACTN